jgi:hypothetical protein
MYTAVKKFRHAVEGRNFVIYIDHKPITYAFVQNPEKSSPRQFRHLDYIAQFTTDVRYIKGEDNNIVDALSRVEAIGKSMDHQTLAAVQESDAELRKIATSNTSALREDTLPRPKRENILRRIRRNGTAIRTKTLAAQHI